MECAALGARPHEAASIQGKLCCRDLRRPRSRAPDLADAQNLLGECLRVLRPGGMIRMVVPDLHSMATDYLNNFNGGSPTPAERIAAAE